MPRAELTITIPESVWVGAVSRAHPDTRIRVLSAVADGDAGVGLVELAGPDVEGVLADLDGREEVTELTVLSAGRDRTLAQFETSVPLLLFPIQGSGVPLEFPFDIENRRAQWELLAPRDRLSELGEQLDAFGIPYTVETVTRQVETEQLLTDRQQRLVRAAVDHGYYDTPRECSLTELADSVGIAKSTASETLHRAEGKVIKEFVEGLGPDAELTSQPAE